MSIGNKDSKIVSDDQPVMAGGSSSSVSGRTMGGGFSRKSITIAICVAAILILVALAYAYKGLVVAATVNGSPITRWSVMSELEKQSGSQVLDGLVTKKLIQAELSKEKITVSSEDVAAEIAKIEDQLKSQGGQTLDQALTQRGMSLSDLKDQIRIQKGVQKALADKTTVTDDEVTKYIKDNKVTIPKGDEATTTSQVRQMLEQQKLGQAAQTWIDDLKKNATIKYFGIYMAPQPTGLTGQ